MYAVIETGGKQYKVAVGDKLKVEKLAVAEGASVNLERVLMVADGEQITACPPPLETVVSATVLSHGRGDRIRVFKMKRRKHYHRTQGHRQSYTEIEITAIGSGKSVAKAEAQAEAKTEAQIGSTAEKSPTKSAVAKKKPATTKTAEKQ